VTGAGALAWVEATESALLDITGMLRTARDDAPAKVVQLLERSKGLEREVQQLKSKLASGESRDLLAEAAEHDGRKILVARLDGLDARTLRDRADQLKSRLGSSIVVLGAVEEDKVRLVVSVTPDIAKTYKAGELIAPIAADVGGRGGGRPDFAQAGGNQPEKLDAALAAARERLIGAA